MSKNKINFVIKRDLGRQNTNNLGAQSTAFVFLQYNMTV